MAKRSTVITRVLDAVAGRRELEPAKRARKLSSASLLEVSDSSSYATSERDQILHRVANTVSSGANRPSSNSETPEALTQYVKSLSNVLSGRAAENSQILQMAPEVNQAAELIIPSIISPNDMRDGLISVTCDYRHSDISDGQFEKINAVILEHANDELKISEKLDAWIYEALYRSGSNPILVVPAGELDRLFNDKNAIDGGSTESIAVEALNNIDKASVFGIADSAFRTDTDRVAFSHKDMTAGMESLFMTIRSDEDLCAPEPKERPVKKANKGTESYNRGATEYDALIKAVTATEALTIIDDVETIKLDSLKKKRRKKKTDADIATRYRPAVIQALQVPDNPSSEENPLFMELPTESVIPLHVPGNPQTHVGYFIALDERGHPLGSNSSTAEQQQLDNKFYDSARRSPFDTMFKAYGLKELRDSMAGARTHDAMAQVYQQVISQHLKSRMVKSGFGDVEPSSMNSIYQHMFSRYMEGRKTRLLYVPKEFMTYMCYRYNEDGTGRSKLEDVKFILALRITLLICHTMSAINDSIDRRTVEVNFEEDAAIGDPLQMIDTIKREYINKNTFGFSIDPGSVMTSLAQKGLTIKANGLPGMNNFTVTNDANDRRSGTVNDGLVDDVRNLLVLSLDVPPSALNNLSENEYSRSIATTNLFFSRKISQLQKLTCADLTDLLQCYLTYSGPLQKKILEILRKGSTEEDSEKKKDEALKEKDQGTVSDKEPTDEDKSASILMEGIIKGMRVTLPPPNIAPDKAQFENFDSFVGSVTNAIENLFGDDLAAGDPEAAEALASVRAAAKSGIFRKYLRTVGFGKELEIPDLDDLVGPGLFNWREILINLHSGLKKSSAVLKPPEGGGDDTSSNAPY